MGAPQLPPEVEEKEDWLITYADAITLLMAFMVMLLTFSEYDIPAFEEAAAAIESNLTGRDATRPIQLLKIDVQDVVYNMQADQVVKVEVDDKGVVIELSASAFYQPGSAVIREEAHPVLEKMSQTFLAPRYQNYVIEIEGHTDDDPINTAQFPSNWELSAGRAAGVVRLLASQGIEPFRMLATGYADTKPKAPNSDLQGKPIVENKNKNRRVALRIYPMSLDERTDFLNKLEVLEQSKKAEEGKIPAQETEAAPSSTPAPPAEGAPDAAPVPNN